MIILKKIISPIPPIKPVINLKVLLLSLRSNNCVKPSIDTGINNIIDSINNSKLKFTLNRNS